MSDNDMLYCLIAFILGWFVSRMMGDGFSVGAGGGSPQDNLSGSKCTRDNCVIKDCNHWNLNDILGNIDQYSDSNISECFWKCGYASNNCEEQIEGGGRTRAVTIQHKNCLDKCHTKQSDHLPR